MEVNGVMVSLLAVQFPGQRVLFEFTLLVREKEFFQVFQTSRKLCLRLQSQATFITLQHVHDELFRSLFPRNFVSF